jgi:deoxyribose-phosphate aldolase
MKLLRLPEDQEIIQGIVSKAELASLLVPSPRDSLINQTCEEAKSCQPSGVLATPILCPQVSAALKGTGIATVCILSLMLAQDENHSNKMFAIHEILKSGVRDFDIMPSVAMTRDKEFGQIEKDFSEMAGVIKNSGGHLSVIIETEAISGEDQALLCQAAINAGADYIRICSGVEQLCGVNGGRATLRSICRIKDLVGEKIKIKAGGGWEYSYLEDCYEYIQSGAGRVDIGPRFIQQLKDIQYRRQVK